MTDLHAAAVERAWLRTVFLAGVQAGMTDVQTHPAAPRDPWDEGRRARLEAAFQQWLTGMLPAAGREQD